MISQYWENISIKRKISGLLALLLSFLFLVIIYSIYKIQYIQNDIKKVAMVDIPIVQIMHQVEYIGQEQQLQFERFQFGNVIPSIEPHKEFYIQKAKIHELLETAVFILSKNLKEHRVTLSKDKHEKILLEIKQFSIQSVLLENKLRHAYSYSKADLPNSIIKEIEIVGSELNKLEQSIIQTLTQVTKIDAYYTKKHQDEFLFVNMVLGICAVILGIGLTGYISQLFLKRIQRIQEEVKTLNLSVRSKMSDLSSNEEKIETDDELVELEQEVKEVMNRLTKEIDHRENVEMQLLQLATQDKLTGLSNRHKWDEQFSIQINLAKRGASFGLIVLDIDHFKKVNDTFGHNIGDQLLMNLGQLLKARLRSTDMAFRLGGEEFAVILPMQDETSTIDVANTLRHNIEVMKCESLPSFTVSLGVTICKQNDTEKSLFNRADAALYEAKARGRNQVVYFD